MRGWNRWLLWGLVTLVPLPGALEASIEYVTQAGELVTQPDGSKMTSTIWVEVNPTVSGMTLTIPTWTCYYHGERYALPTTTFTLQAHPNETKHAALYIVPGKKGIDYVLLDSQDPGSFAERQAKLQEQDADEAVAIAWFDLPPGTTDLATIPIYVLKHVHA